MLNEVIIMGRLTADPVLQSTDKGVPYCKFILANEGEFFKEGGERPVNFIFMTAWRSTAEFICRNFMKGKLMIAEGSLRVASYTSKDNELKFISNVEVARAYFAGDKKSSVKSDAAYDEEEETINKGIEDFNLEEYEEILLGEDVPF